MLDFIITYVVSIVETCIILHNISYFCLVSSSFHTEIILLIFLRADIVVINCCLFGNVLFFLSVLKDRVTGHRSSWSTVFFQTFEYISPLASKISDAKSAYNLQGSFMCDKLLPLAAFKRFCLLILTIWLVYDPLWVYPTWR